MTFRQDFGLWWPDYDHAPEKNHRLVRDRVTDLDLAVAQCRQRRVAVQAGGHAGIWPARLAGRFEHVLTFEPEPRLFECLRRNLLTLKNVTVSQDALGDGDGPVPFRGSVSAGSWRVDPAGQFSVNQTRLDHVQVPGPVDLIALDVEGYEVQALAGATQIIHWWHPVIMVELLPRSRDAIEAHLRWLGYHRVAAVHNDAIYRYG